MLQHNHLTVYSDLKVLVQIQDWFKQFCLANGSDRFWLTNQIYPLSLALTEGFTNAVRHAHQGLPLETEVEIDLSLWDDRLEIRIWDYGQGFDPDAIEEPKPGTLCLGGYGWFLLRRLADQVSYQRDSDQRNCLLIVKHRVRQSNPNRFVTPTLYSGS